MKNKTEKFITKSKKLYDKCDYSLVNYVNSRTKVKVICPIHGVFEIRPEKFLKSGCPNCDKQKNFIKKSETIHSCKYDYSLSIYIKNNIPLKIICPIHGIFKQRPDSHLVGKGCPRCANKNITNDIFIKRMKIIHKNKYDYSLVKYIKDDIKVKIICPIHGVFEQTPNAHSQGQGCAQCKFDKHRLGVDEFIFRSNIKHNNKYDYSFVEYTDNLTKIIIVCPEHGIFKQTPKNHLVGQGCPICKESKGENKVRLYLEKKRINFMREYKFNGCKDKNPLPFDFYLPELNVCIEYDGIQHFEPIEYFGGKDEYVKLKRRDKIKTEYCEENNIKLIRIKYNENISHKLFNIYNLISLRPF